MDNLQEAIEAMQDILPIFEKDLPRMKDSFSAARRVRSAITKVKKVGKDLRRLSLEHDKAIKEAKQ